MDSGWDETGPRTRARARPLARGEGRLGPYRPTRQPARPLARGRGELLSVVVASL